MMAETFVQQPLLLYGRHAGRPHRNMYDFPTCLLEESSKSLTVNVLPPIEAGASCFNENSATDSKELRRLTLSPQA